MIRISRGATRACVLIGPWAVKFPRIARGGGHRGLAGVLWSFTRGVQANLSERAWSHVPGVVPVQWSLFGLVNVYRRCQPVTEFPPDHAAYLALAPAMPAIDLKPANLGVLNGRVHFLDYDVSWNGCWHDPLSPHVHPPHAHAVRALADAISGPHRDALNHSVPWLTDQSLEGAS